MAKNKKVAASYRQRLRDYIQCIKSSSKCCHCGEGRSICLDFHHKDPRTKSFELSDGKGHSFASIDREIKKCIIICSNCHRVLHAQEKAENIIMEREEEIFPLFDFCVTDD